MQFHGFAFMKKQNNNAVIFLICIKTYQACCNAN